MAGQYAHAHEMLGVLNEQFGFGLVAEDFAEHPELMPYVAWVPENTGS